MLVMTHAHLFREREFGNGLVGEVVKIWYLWADGEAVLSATILLTCSDCDNLEQKISDEEMVVIDKVGKEELNLVAELDLEIVRGLYRRGLIYLEVPVYPDDHFQG